VKPSSWDEHARYQAYSGNVWDDPRFTVYNPIFSLPIESLQGKIFRRQCPIDGP
jgi:hypothetical protein